MLYCAVREKNPQWTLQDLIAVGRVIPIGKPASRAYLMSFFADLLARGLLSHNDMESMAQYTFLHEIDFSRSGSTVRQMSSELYNEISESPWGNLFLKPSADRIRDHLATLDDRGSIEILDFAIRLSDSHPQLTRQI